MPEYYQPNPLIDFTVCIDVLRNGMRINTVSYRDENGITEFEVVFRSPLQYRPVQEYPLSQMSKMIGIVKLLEDKIKSYLVKWMEANIKTWDI